MICKVDLISKVQGTDIYPQVRRMLHAFLWTQDELEILSDLIDAYLAVRAASNNTRCKSDGPV